MTTSATETELDASPAAIGKRIAFAIRNQGHFKGGVERGVCIVTAAAFPRGVIRTNFVKALREHIGLPAPIRPDYSNDIIEWNDATPTETVLEKLETIPDAHSLAATSEG